MRGRNERRLGTTRGPDRRAQQWPANRGGGQQGGRWQGRVLLSRIPIRLRARLVFYDNFSAEPSSLGVGGRFSSRREFWRKSALAA